MSDRCAQDAVIVEAALQRHPDIAAGLGLVMLGELGDAPRELLIRCLAKRLRRGDSLPAALIPAFADGLRTARVQVERDHVDCPCDRAC